MSWLQVKRLAISLLFLSTVTVYASSSVLFQAGLLNAVENGFIIGDYTYKKLMKQGDFGLGTFNDLDGEMVALDGDYYQYWPGGKTKSVDKDLFTPFAQVIKFKSVNEFKQKEEMNKAKLWALITSHLENKNIPYAIRIDGKFKNLTLNSRFPVSQANSDPSARTFKIEKTIEGTLVGYWFPKDLVSLTVPGYHFHFISENRKLAGHLVDLTLLKGKIKIMPVYDIQLALPQAKLSKQQILKAPTEASYKADDL